MLSYEVFVILAPGSELGTHTCTHTHTAKKLVTKLETAKSSSTNVSPKYP